MNSFLAYDESTDKKRPGILIIPEWWGLNDYVKGRARQLAALGYIALAVDLYGYGKTANTPDSAIYPSEIGRASCRERVSKQV